MEALLRHFQNYGMKDLSFLIVNSKGALSRSMFDQLQERVSFPVYQETPEEQVWSVMEGGKDDMFVYDRCGRLTYYIPFPLSIIHEKQTIVQAAVMSTYFQSPCGFSCTEDPSPVITDLLEEDKQDVQEQGDANNDINGTGANHIEEEVPSLENDIIVDESASIIVDENATLLVDENATSIESYDTYDFSNSTNYTSEESSGNTTSHTENLNASLSDPTPTRQSLLSSLLNFMRGRAGDSAQPEATPPEADPTSRPGAGPTIATNGDIESSESEPEVLAAAADAALEDASCVGFERNACALWKKPRIQHAKRCCAAHASASAADHERLCKRYGRKRCKKIQPMLKCCLKREASSREGALAAEPLAEEPLAEAM